MEATVVAAAKADTEEVRMTFGEHLEELRWRLVKALVAWTVCFVAAIFFFVVDQVLSYRVRVLFGLGQ